MAEREDLNVVVFGGCGFIGRNLVSYIIDNDLASYVRVVDKVPPQVAWLNKHHQEVMLNPKVEFKSANLINSASAESSLAGCKFDIAFNCAGETKPGQTEPVYREGVYQVIFNVAKACELHSVGRLVEISSGEMASSDKVHKEDERADPWSLIAKFKLKGEEALAELSKTLNTTIVRPGIVYGPADKSGICPRLIIGGLYQYLGERLRLLWDGSLYMNTVHVDDLCRCVWFLSNRGDTIGQVYNLVDDSDTTQGSLTDLVSDIFNINHDYIGNVMSTLCKVNENELIEEINEKHAGPWAEACRLAGVENTPLSPCVHADALHRAHLRLDSSKVKAMGFTLCHPNLSKALLLEILEDYIQMKLFPKLLLN